MTDLPPFGSVLYAKDFRAVADFYAKVTGLKVRESNDEYVMLETAGYFLVVLQIPKRIADTIPIDTPPERREQTPVKLVFAVESLQKARAKAAAHGGTLNAQAHEWVFHGSRRCDGIDPEGNVIQFREQPR